MSSPIWRDDVRRVRPMLASLADAPLQGERLVYEPKYDGIRALVAIDPRAAAVTARVAIFSRLGTDKTAVFPDLVRELERVARTRTRPLLLDGEIVALDAGGQPASFTKLQHRIGVRGERASASASAGQPVAFVAFDLLRDGEEDLRALALSARRVRLERVWSETGSALLRLSEFAAGSGEALMRRATHEGWEGLIAKHLDSRYHSGKRTADWKKIKLVHRQEFIVCGWTPQRGVPAALGALLLGVRQGRQLMFAGSVGSGFDRAEREHLIAVLERLASGTCPLAAAPALDEAARWVRPELVADVKFAEWTPGGHLRHPVYLGLRDDVAADAVVREAAERPTLAAAATRRSARTPGRATARAARSTPGADPEAGQRDAVVARLEEIERGGGSGAVALPDGSSLDVTNLGKVFWPASRLTKGDLLRYYVRVAPLILPVVADRPLVMKRLPNGIAGKAFYQQRGPEHAPAGVRVEAVDGDTDVPNRVIGGTLRTLLYMAQLAVVSQDPWFSRVSSPDEPDFVAFDLDPMPGVSFAQVCDVARWVHDELVALGIPGSPKTSGSSGLHVFVKVPPGLPFEAGLLFTQIVATVVAQKHPAAATVERAVTARGPKVYVDYLQNIRGKSLACAYSARASEFAGVSMPLTWDEIEEGVDPRDFTIVSAPAWLARTGDRWASALGGPPADLSAVFRYVEGGR